MVLQAENSSVLTSFSPVIVFVRSYSKVVVLDRRSKSTTGPAMTAPKIIAPWRKLKAYVRTFGNVSFLQPRMRTGKMMESPNGAIVVSTR